MKKCLLLLTAFNLFVIYGVAQSQSLSASSNGKFNIGVEAGLPAYPTSVNLIIGGSVKYELPVSYQTYVTISAAYSSFLNNTSTFVSNVPSSYGYIPIKVGLKYYVLAGFFLEGQTGVTFATRKYNDEASTAYFAYSPGVGYTFGAFDAGVRFEGWLSGESVIDQAILRVGYQF